MRRERRYLIWNTERGAWWRGGQHGYTLDLGEAGRFTEAEARGIVAQSERDDGPGAEVMMLEPTGRVPAPLYSEIVAAARVLAAEHPETAPWMSAELVQLLDAVRGQIRLGPACPACGHPNTHVARRGCAAWVPGSSSVLNPTGHRCGCLHRRDAED